MNGSCESPEEKLCGCCEGIAAQTPELIYNPPGLTNIEYRAGTHATFKASLLAALSSSVFPALAPLRTRDDSDFSIALLDAWAVSLDILTFYQERLANEAYLDTAVDPASVFYLAELVGYKPSPGVAASAYLAFTLTSAPGAPDNVLIPEGTRVQSVPRPGQTPQVFETAGGLTALIECNAIPPRLSAAWQLNSGDSSIWIQGTDNNLHVGDWLLFTSSQFDTSDPWNSGGWDYHVITSVSTDPISGNTFVTWDSPLLLWYFASVSYSQIYVFRKKAALFGVQAPDPRTLSTTGNNISSLTGWPSAGPGDWSFNYAGNSQINLDSSYPGLAPTRDGETQWALFLSPDNTYAPYQVLGAGESSPVLYTLTGKTTQLNLADEPIRDSNGDITKSNDDVLTTLVGETRQITAYVQSELLAPADTPLSDWAYDDTYSRQSGLLRPVEGSVLEVVTSEALSPGQVVGVLGKRMRLQIAHLATKPVGSQPGFVPNGATGANKVSDSQMFLVDAFPPQTAANSVDGLWSVLTPDGVAGTLQISAGNLVLVPADKNDLIVGESVAISQSTVSGSIQDLSFGPALARLYDRSTVTVNANVVAASHGETVHELLGNGDATNEALEFTLKQSPLTFLSSASGLGAASTLQVWVNNLRWQEVDNFLHSGPSDRAYITQADSQGKVTVQFGNGAEGARTPTGQMNIRAVYRKGLGAAGNVDAGQLSQALDRPQGLKGVTNPDAATGGADPDSADSARLSAPLHVLTLDRAVSLEDYQNYALAFAGISKALATWTWDGLRRAVVLTLAGAQGGVFHQDDLTIQHLKSALRAAGNPYVPVTVADPSYNPVLFEVAANVQVDTTDYDPTQVLAQVWQALSANLSFAQRQFGQGVAQSEIIALIQGVAGVIAVQLKTFNRMGEAPSGPLPAVLRAAGPVVQKNGVLTAAELLLLDPASQGNFEVWS